MKNDDLSVALSLSGTLQPSRLERRADNFQLADHLPAVDRW